MKTPPIFEDELDEDKDADEIFQCLGREQDLVNCTFPDLVRTDVLFHFSVEDERFILLAVHFCKRLVATNTRVGRRIRRIAKDGDNGIEETEVQEDRGSRVYKCKQGLLWSIITTFPYYLAVINARVTVIVPTHHLNC
ncbi:uncharacterized protein DS421_2g46160 [Arachis hypogaea]|nr:uncharacterized protein DS421_2g46160 [Arachis hypogaea]